MDCINEMSFEDAKEEMIRIAKIVKITAHHAQRKNIKKFVIILVIVVGVLFLSKPFADTLRALYCAEISIGFIFVVFGIRNIIDRFRDFSWSRKFQDEEYLDTMGEEFVKNELQRMMRINQDKQFIDEEGHKCYLFRG